MTRREGTFAGGEWQFGHGAPMTSVDPASGELVWMGHCSSKEQINSAVNAARNAFPTWAERSLKERIDVLITFRSILEDSDEELGLAISRETGKPLWEARSEVRAMASKITVSIDAYYERCPERTVHVGNSELTTRHRPHGVVAVLSPFNFPGHIPNGHIVPALLAGNTVVNKASELTPLVGILIASYWETAGLPRGVLNLVQGGPQVGQQLVTHHNLDGLFFTGSAEAGKAIAAHYGFHVSKILALEMGGNNPLIVYESEDPTAAAYCTLQSAYLTAGQRCTSARRLIVPEGADGDSFLYRLEKLIDGLRVGSFRQQPEPFMGPVVSVQAAERLLNAQDQLLRRGAVRLREMRLLKEGTGLLSPGLIDVTGVRARKDVELFGPLLQVIRVRDIESAICEANDTAFGLSAGIFTRHRELYEQFYRHARAGVINWNTPLTGASSLAPFGGVGRSGNYRPTAYYAADYCSYPVASMELERLQLPEHLNPGVQLPKDVTGSVYG